MQSYGVSCVAEYFSIDKLYARQARTYATYMFRFPVQIARNVYIGAMFICFCKTLLQIRIKVYANSTNGKRINETKLFGAVCTFHNVTHNFFPPHCVFSRKFFSLYIYTSTLTDIAFFSAQSHEEYCQRIFIVRAW